ncbi:MAG: glycerol acyltransferase [Deltaproteobacteria bacterium 13_1_20CM_2_69_21]|nr:MAG: glycerol acyltransferase [Deltaproteobacteria bacterium 13_1_20CM_2_69_21]
MQRTARWLLALAGWSVDLPWPPEPRGIIVVYPHTSNWDFVVGILALLATGLPAQWVAKDTLFRWPFAGLLRCLGGIPVNRREHTGFIEQLAAEFRHRSWMWLALAPEGTRARTEHWKSGFYHLALAVGVPVGLGFLDYGRRVAGVTSWLSLSGDQGQDLARIRAFYADKTGLHPALAGKIRLRDDI